jgi:DNA polymerase III delta subunit
MKITLIHGTHTEKSRARFQAILDGVHKRGWEVIHLSQTSTIAELLSSTSLFENKRVYVCQDLKIFDDKTLKFLEKKSKALDSNLLLYHPSFAPAKILNFVKNYGQIEAFEFPKTIWAFLDSLYPGNSKTSLKLLQEVKKTEALEFSFALVAGLYRDLYWAKVDPKSLSLPSWKLTKLKNQSSKYSQDLLKAIINLLARIDISAKTSNIDLSQSLDLFILKNLK